MEDDDGDDNAYIMS